MLTPDLVKFRLKQLGVPADKWLGQHFLIDANVLAKIKEVSGGFVGEDDTIVEVGPGLGVLTDSLLDWFDRPVVAVEMDPVLAQSLSPHDRLTLLQGDILDKLDRDTFFKNLETWVVVANIPYAITSPLVRKLLHRPNPPHDCLLLVQKELAERICAKPGNSDRGLLTVQVELMAEAEMVAQVPPSSFWPEPKVDSALLHLKLRPNPLVAPETMPAVLRMVTAGFSAKRKQLANSLAGGLGKSTEDVRIILKNAKIDPMRRAETLTIHEWLEIAQAV